MGGAARELAKRGRCIIYDRRGLFRSECPEPFDSVDLIDHVEDAAGLLDSLSATPAVVIGRSTGGEIALELARCLPDKVRALLLLEPAVFTVDPEATAWADRAARKGAAGSGGQPLVGRGNRIAGGAGGPDLEPTDPHARPVNPTCPP